MDINMIFVGAAFVFLCVITFKVMCIHADTKAMNEFIVENIGRLGKNQDVLQKEIIAADTTIRRHMDELTDDIKQKIIFEIVANKQGILTEIRELKK